jgi:MFS family permease
MKYFQEYLRLPRTIYILFFARIINSIGSFVYPLLTILLTSKLGFSADQAGIITTIAISAGGVGMLIGGKLADKIGRKKLLIISSLAGAAAFIVCAFLGTSRSIIYFIVIGNFLSITQWPIVDAMVTDSTNKKNRQTAFSLLYMGTNIGIAVGPLMAGFLINEYLTWFFLIDAFTTILSLIPIIIFVKDTKPTHEEIKAVSEYDMERGEQGSIFRALIKRPLVLMFTFVLVLFAFVYAQYTFGLPLFINHIYGYDGPKIFGAMMTINALMVVFLTLPIITLTKKIKPLINIIIGGILYTLGFGILFFVQDIYLLVFSTVLWTLGEIIMTVNVEVFIANNSPITHRGRFFAMITFIYESGFAIAPLLSGFYIASFGIRNIWPIVAIFAISASLFMFGLFLFERKKRSAKV